MVTRGKEKEGAAYLDIDVGHEDGKVGEVGAGARGVGPVGDQQTAVLGGPVTRHGSLRVTPEGAVGVEVFLGLLVEMNNGEIEKN